MKLNKKQVMDFLPHRDPFLFIDSVEIVHFPEGVKPQDVKGFKEMIGGSVVAHFRVTDELKVLEGHFPGNPILPGVVQLEMMAQASTFINYDMVVEYGKHNPLNIDVALLGVDHSRFRKPVVPNMDLRIESTFTKVRGSFVSYEAKIFHDSELISEAGIFASYKYF